VAIAGGFSPRALKTGARVSRIVDGRTVTATVPLSYPLRPGDTVTIDERWF
jgi:polysaccharide export outer membrane protein